MTKDKKIREVMELVEALAMECGSYQIGKTSAEKVDESYDAIESKLRELIQ